MQRPGRKEGHREATTHAAGASRHQVCGGCRPRDTSKSTSKRSRKQNCTAVSHGLRSSFRLAVSQHCRGGGGPPHCQWPCNLWSRDLGGPWQPSHPPTGCREEEWLGVWISIGLLPVHKTDVSVPFPSPPLPCPALDLPPRTPLPRLPSPLFHNEFIHLSGGPDINSSDSRASSTMGQTSAPLTPEGSGWGRFAAGWRARRGRESDEATREDRHFEVRWASLGGGWSTTAHTQTKQSIPPQHHNPAIRPLTVPVCHPAVDHPNGFAAQMLGQQHVLIQA